jgi:hypothetical protein
MALIDLKGARITALDLDERKVTFRLDDTVDAATGISALIALLSDGNAVSLLVSPAPRMFTCPGCKRTLPRGLRIESSGQCIVCDETSDEAPA